MTEPMRFRPAVLEPTAVTKENIDEVIIDGGFHRRDEVYLNADYS